jgi:hypothetical protein
MLDDLERLHEVPSLRALLSHYAILGKEDRQVWQDRVMELDGAGKRDLTRLHGELLAYGWVEQNTGVTPGGKGLAPGCYRITAAGVRALRQATSLEPGVA